MVQKIKIIATDEIKFLANAGNSKIHRVFDTISEANIFINNVYNANRKTIDRKIV